MVPAKEQMLAKRMKKVSWTKAVVESIILTFR